MTLLSIVSGASVRCGLGPQTSAFTSPDQNVQQFVAFAQDTGTDLRRRWNWRNFITPISFTGDGTTTQFSLPAGFQSFFPSTTLISSAYPTMALRGPVNADELQRLKAIPATVLPAVWRLIGNFIEFFPALAYAEVVSGEYETKYWIQPASGFAVSAWTADADTSLIDEDLIMKGAIWMWKRAKGLDYAEEFNAFEAAFNMVAGQENSERVISISSPGGLPDGFWGGQIFDRTSFGQ